MTSPSAPAAARGEAAARRGAGRAVPGWLSAGCVAVAIVATLATTRLLFLQQDANWDLKNYHAYNGWALFRDGLSVDLHPAAFQSYLNPLLDVLNFVAVSVLDARLGTALLVAIQLSAVVPLTLIVRELLPGAHGAVTWAAAVLGLGGAIVTSEWGTTFGDLTVALPVLWSVWFLLRVPRSGDRAGRTAVVGGVLMGAATALKLTTLPFTLAAVVACMVLVPRAGMALRWVAGTAGGFLVVAGPWMVAVWRETGNPVFPLLNSVFGSPYYASGDPDDARFGVTSLGQVLALPFQLADAPQWLTSELPSADLRWPLWGASVVALAVVTLLASRWSRVRSTGVPLSWRAGAPRMRRLLALQALCVVAYTLWAVVFGIQRYALVIEMLAVPVAVATLALLVRGQRPLVGAVVTLGVLLGLTTATVDWGRIPMPTGPAIPIGSMPELSSYSAVLLAGAPSAYTAVAVGGRSDAGTRPAWIGSPFTEADRRRGLDRLGDGPVAVVVRADVPDPPASAAAAAALFELAVDGPCRPVPSPLLETMLLCRTAPRRT